MTEILLKGSQQKVNEEQAKAIPTQILQGWEELTKKGKDALLALKNAKGKEAPKNVDLKSKIS